jgi:hypothetical protein
MVSDWFEEDNFKHTVRQVLIDALKEIKVDFHGLDPVVQATLLDEAAQVGVQRSLQPLMRIKAVRKRQSPTRPFKSRSSLKSIVSAARRSGVDRLKCVSQNLI